MAGMDPQQLRWQLIQAEEKRTREIIERDFGCGRMNTTKWREAISAISEVEVNCRVKFVDNNDVLEVLSIWFVTGDWFDCPRGPFTSVSIEWLEVEAQGGPIIKEAEGESTNGVLDKIAQLWQQSNIPFEKVDHRLRVVGYFSKSK